MTGRALYFTGERSVEVRDQPIPTPGTAEVRVRTERSGISPGTERLVYRGEVSRDRATDETIDALDGTFSYPLQYGYAAVGRVTAVGTEVDDDWLDKRVFAFNPHETHFLATPETLIETTLAPDQALFIPTVETAVGLVMDARPRVGSRVVVFGQGPVGLATTAVLAAFPLAELVTVDPSERRRSLSASLGADRSVAPTALETVGDDGADVTFELSGHPGALDDAIDATGYAGTVIVGSWYGTKPVTLSLDDYHRSHIRIRSSQVSRIDAEHADRWDKARRLDFVRSWLAETSLSELVTHEFAFDRAPEAYRLLDQDTGEAVQLALTYE